MKKLFFIGIALVALIACGAKSEKNSQKQSEEELRTAIVGSWYVLTGKDSIISVDSSESSKEHPIDFKGLGMAMRRVFFNDGRYMEREDSKIVADGDTATFLLYSIQGKWEIHGDSLILTAKMEDVENPEHAGITAKNGTIISKKIIKSISADSLIIEDNLKDMSGNVMDLIMLKE